MNIFTLLGTIAVNNEQANKAITDTTKHAQKAKGKISQAFEGIGKAAVTCGKIVAVGTAAGAAAFGALFKASIGEYAEYEQLVGGIETLFKDSKRRVMDYANQAYKTAGLSANEYMSTVTSFSASLLQGLDGDTEKAAELANMAITDMSDNANKMGTSMKSIQDAYQGFAKQNYTMLDNLKLGYGGTQAEMARLINDSGVLGDAITVTAETVNQVPFNKIIEAIHVVQTEMDITGTTAKEASTTISGSFASFKATWKNLLAGLTNKDADMAALFGNFTAAGETVLKNVLALLPPFKENVAVLMVEAGQYIHDKVRDTVWPKVQEAMDIDWLTENIGEPVEKFRTNVIEPIAGWWNEKIVPAITGTAAAVDSFLGIGLVEGWDSLTKNIQIAWGNVTTAIVEATNAISAFLSLSGNTGLGGGDARPWYVKENPDKYTNQSQGGAPGSMPTIKENAEGAIFTRPTIFDTRLGYQMVGEAGAEAVLPISKMQGYIRDAMRETLGGLQLSVVLDTGVLVGQITPQLDMQLGTLANRKGRG